MGKGKITRLYQLHGNRGTGTGTSSGELPICFPLEEAGLSGVITAHPTRMLCADGECDAVCSRLIVSF